MLGAWDMTDERRSGVDRRIEALGGRRAGDQRYAGVVAGRLTDAFRASRMTFLQVAVKACMSEKAAREAIKGETDPKLSTIIALADVLRVPLEDLFKPRAA